MKHLKREVPRDDFSVAEGPRRISVYKNYQKIVLSAADYEGKLKRHILTFDQLYKWIQENGE